jgi:hypothetical protein
MNLHPGSTINIEHSDVRNGSETRLHGRGLLIARASWIALTLFILTLNAVMIPRYDAVLQAHCQPGSLCVAFQLTTYDRQLLHQFGLSLGFLAAYQVMLSAVTVVVNGALGALIFWRKSADRMAFFCACMLVLFGGASSNILQYTLMPVSPAWFVLIGTLGILGQSSFITFFFLFPSGRFVPRWTRWVALCFVLYWMYTTFSTNIFYNASALSNLVFFAFLLCAVGAQIYRYRRVSTFRERQQTKWVVLGFSTGIVGFVLFLVLGNALLPPAVLQSSVMGTLIAGTVVDGFLLLIPISIALAILRSRLWDIDIIINKALVYGLLSGILGVLYAGLIIGLESLVGLFAAQKAQPIVIVLSTLAIAALFQPLRGRIQQLIDRRFYRRKYNAARTLEAFSAALRNEVDLATLSEHLVAVVQETMQPASVSLWLRSPAHHGNHQVLWRAEPPVPSEDEKRVER